MKTLRERAALMVGKLVNVLPGGFICLGIAGCVTVSHVDLTERYNLQYVAYATRDGHMPTEIKGHPFGGVEMEGRTLASLELPGWHQTRPFHLATKKERRNVRLVFYFDPADPTFDGAMACRGKAATHDSSGPIMTVQAAFCGRSVVVSDAIVRAPRPAGPETPAFKEMMYQLLATLLPPSNDVHKGECATPPCN